MVSKILSARGIDGSSVVAESKLGVESNRRADHETKLKKKLTIFEKFLDLERMKS